MQRTTADLLELQKARTGKRAQLDQKALRSALNAIPPTGNGSRPGASDLDEARAEKTRLQAQLVAIQLAEKRGELVPAKNALDEVERICLELRAQLITIPSKWAPQLAKLSQREVQTQLRVVVDEALEALSQGLEIPGCRRRRSTNVI